MEKKSLIWSIKDTLREEVSLRDLHKVIFLLEQAAKAGSAEACKVFGTYLLYGIEPKLKKDPARAAKYLQLAKDKGIEGLDELIAEAKNQCR